MTINELIDIEKKLLTIEKEHKFDLSFNELLTLTNELKRIGDITSLFFNIQYEYSQKVSAEYEELNLYREKLINSDINVDISDAKELINAVDKRFS